MKIVYIDEAGTSHNPKMSDTNPYYVLCGICCDSNNYESKCRLIDQNLPEIRMLDQHNHLGKGYEIKGKEIFANSNGKCWWNNHLSEKEHLMAEMLDFPEIAWLIVLNKNKHYNKYSTPIEPIIQNLRLLFERIQWYLLSVNDYAICIYDQTAKNDEILHRAAMNIIIDGSRFDLPSDSYAFKIDRILEFHLGNSRNSVGLQVADFYATAAFQYYKKNKPKEFVWWDKIAAHLYKKDHIFLGMV